MFVVSSWCLLFLIYFMFFKCVLCIAVTIVCYTAVFSVVTQSSSPERCVTTLKTAV